MSVLGDERASAPTELVLITPLLLLLLLFVVFVGRLSTARLDVTAAARDAARAASLRASPDDAVADATAAAAASLAERGMACREMAVDVDITRFSPGGSVAVQVRCTANLADLALLRVPGSRDVTATAREVIDVYGIRS